MNRSASAALGSEVTWAVHVLGGTPRHVVHLWHGRGGSGADGDVLLPGLARAVDAGDLPPLLVVAPDAPWGDGGHWYVDSARTGLRVGTALGVELVAEVERRYGVTPDRAHRVVVGHSMGAHGALRHALDPAGAFGAAVALAPPTWHPLPPADSSARSHGAFGVGSVPFDEARWRRLSPHTLAPGSTARVALAVGERDVLLGATRTTYDALVTAGVPARLEVVPGVGHDLADLADACVSGVVGVLPWLASAPCTPTEPAPC